MPYCTREDIEARLPALPPEESNEKTEAQIVEGIADAEAEINGRLGALYSVPFSPVPPLVVKITAYLAAAFVLDSGYSGTAEDTRLATHYRSLAEERLQRIIAGELLLYPEDTTGLEGDGFYASADGPEPILLSYNPYAI